ncbi:MAG: hypothetical protein AAGJ87_06815 [Pseudomonadota bacterium]
MMNAKFRALLRGALAGAACAGLAACGSNDLSQYQTFSSSGTALTNSIPALYDAYYETAIDADAAQLILTRPALTADDRRAVFAQAHENLQARADIIGDLKRHARLLRAYFTSMDALARSDAPTSISTSAGGVVDALNGLSPTIENATIGDVDVKSFVGPVVELIVQAKISKALDARFRADAAVIDRELNLHAAALEAVKASIMADQEVIRQIDIVRNVRNAYASDGALPKDWAIRWRTSLSPSPEVEAIDAAADAMKKVRTAYAALAEGRSGLDQTLLLLQDVSDVLALIEQIEGES